MARIDGVVSFEGSVRGKRKLVVKNEETAQEEEHLIPTGKHIIVQPGDVVTKGQHLTEGSADPHEILEILGPSALYDFLISQVQEVYRLQGVTINDKHIEIIVRQMLRKVRITEAGDTSFLWGEQVDKLEFEAENEAVERKGGKPAEALPNWEKAFELEPTWLTSGSSLTHEYGFTLVAAGQAAKARLVFQRAYEKGGSPSLMLRSLALLDMYEGKFRDARRELQQAVLLAGQTQNYMHAARHHEFLAILAEAEGDRAGFRREAEAAAREMSRSTWQTALNARIGALFARAGAFDRAEASLATVRRHADSAGQLETGYRNYLEGSIALARGQRSRAAELLEAAAASAEEALALGPLAQAYAGMQEQDRAIACLERLTRMPAQPLGWEAQQPWLEAHAGLAEQYLARGRKAEAAAVIRPLLELWREADSSLPLRVRLNRLAEAVK